MRRVTRAPLNVRHSTGPFSTTCGVSSLNSSKSPIQAPQTRSASRQREQQTLSVATMRVSDPDCSRFKKKCFALTGPVHVSLITLLEAALPRGNLLLAAALREGWLAQAGG